MLVQGSRGDMIPAFDLEGFHGTMLMRLDVVQGQRTWRSHDYSPSGTNSIQHCMYKRLDVLVFKYLSYYSLRQTIRNRHCTHLK